MELADRVAVLHKGDLQQVGTPDAIYDKPANPFVYAFIGDSTGLPVTMERGRALLDGTSLSLTGVDAPDGPARIHVRPQDVTIAPESEAVVTGVIAGLRRSGPSRRADITVGERHTRIEALLPPETQVSVGDRVGLAFRRFAAFPDDQEPPKLGLARAA